MFQTTQPIGTCSLLINPEGKVLLGKRKNSYKAGSYGLPGGRIELNEPIDVAIQREVREETGLQVDNLKYIGVVRENQGDHDFIHFVFAAENIEQTPTLTEPEKCEGWEWVELNDFDGEILAGHTAAIQLYFEKNNLVDITR